MTTNARPGFLRRIGGAGPLRVILLATSALTVLSIVGCVTLSRPAPEPTPEPSRTSRMPDVNQLPGGQNTNPHLEELRLERARREAAEAELRKASYTPAMGTFRAREPGAPDPDQRQAEIEITPDPPADRTVQASAPPPTEADIKAYREAIAALVGTWGGKPSEGKTYDMDQRQAAGGTPGADRYAQGPVRQASASLAPAVSSQARKRVLMPGLRGVLGQVVIGGSSDQGSPPIIVQAMSGPVAGLRLSGSFSRAQQNNGPAQGLVVRMNQMTLPDGTQVPVDAILVAPGTMESMVASRRDPHTMERVVLPMAAAFVQGLGQAIATSGSIVAQGPLGGGYSAFREFNTSQLLGIGAGAAAQSASQLLREQAPREPTTYIDARSEVGIFFLSPVEVGD